MAAPIRTIIDQFFAAKDSTWQSKLTKNWESIIGPLHSHMRLERVDNDTVFLGVYDVHWMQELYLLSRTIIRTINTGLGANHVHHVRFRIVQRRDHQDKEDFVITTSRQMPLRPLSLKEQRALEAVADEQLKSVLRSFLQRMNREK
jgi:hypothetical protein